MTAAAPADYAVEVAAALCRRFEGFYALPYLCPAGVPTIGYGATYYPDGRAVKLTDSAITKDQAEAMLLHSIRTEYLPAVLRLCQGIPTPEALAAIIDFTFNLGETKLAGSTLRKRINSRRWGDVPAELKKWILANGRPLRGLILRRGAEADLWGGALPPPEQDNNPPPRLRLSYELGG